MTSAQKERGGNKFTNFADNQYTEKCRFIDKRVREISRFFVAQPRVFPLSVCACASQRTVLSTNTFSSVYFADNEGGGGKKSHIVVDVIHGSPLNRSSVQ